MAKMMLGRYQLQMRTFSFTHGCTLYCTFKCLPKDIFWNTLFWIFSMNVFKAKEIFQRWNKFDWQTPPCIEMCVCFPIKPNHFFSQTKVEFVKFVLPIPTSKLERNTNAAIDKRIHWREQRVVIRDICKRQEEDIWWWDILRRLLLTRQQEEEEWSSNPQCFQINSFTCHKGAGTFGWKEPCCVHYC